MKKNKYKDNKSTVRPHYIKEGDQVLLRRQEIKLKSPYGADPYTVLEVHGTQTVARRREKRRSRDAQFWKKLDTEPRRDFTALKKRGIRREDDYLPDIRPQAP